ASLQGSDVSVQDRAMARLGTIVQVEKNGALVSGTPAQSAVKQAETLLAQGDINGAIAQMQSLSGPAASAAAPWLSKAKVSLSAQRLQSMLTNAISLKAHGTGVTTA